MAETVNKDKKIFADKIRMLAKSIYDAADDIAGTTDGCIEISVSFDIETETEEYAGLPTYTVVRRHYPQKDIVDDFFNRMSDTSETEEHHVLSIDSDPVAYKEMLDKEIERAKTAAIFPTHVTLSHDEALRAFGKCCTTCLYENDIDCMECNTCVRNPDLVDYTCCADNWRDYK